MLNATGFFVFSTPNLTRDISPSPTLEHVTGIKFWTWTLFLTNASFSLLAVLFSFVTTHLTTLFDAISTPDDLGEVKNKFKNQRSKPLIAMIHVKFPSLHQRYLYIDPRE